MFVDCRNITIDAIDLSDPNTSSPSTMEFGYGFYRVSGGSNGCRNNTIKNCQITLGTPNTLNSSGIEMSYSNYLFNTLLVIPSSNSQTNSFNLFYNNSISKCDFGIKIIGPTASFFVDEGNDIGGNSSLTGNTIFNFGGGVSFAEGVYALYQDQLNVSFNKINNNNGLGLPAIQGLDGIYSSTEYNATINSNTISLEAIGSSPLNGIKQLGGITATGTVSISNNVFPNFSHNTILNVVFPDYAINVDGNNISLINNNIIGNFIASSGTVALISATSGYTAFINNNSISGATIAANGSIQGIKSTSFQQTINNNLIGNFYSPWFTTNTSNRMGGIESASGCGILSVNNNTISNLYGLNNYGMYFINTISTSNFSITGNKITNLGPASTGNLGSTSFGIVSDIGINSGTMTIKSNTISNLVGEGLVNTMYGGEVVGIVSGNGLNSFVSQNKIYDLSTSGSYFLHGIRFATNNGFIFNNLVGELQSSFGNVQVLYLTGGNNRVYFNTLYLSNTVNTVTPIGDIGSNLITSINGATLDLRNNILINTSMATGTGVTSVLIGNLTPTSNRNAYYFGLPSSSRMILNGVPSTSVITAFQSIFNSDAQSFVENPPFASLIGSNSNFLNINPLIATQIEGGAASISTITTDFANNLRSSPPDVGAWEGNYTAADITAPVIVSSGFTAPPCNNSSRTFTANLTDVSGVASGSLAPRIYYKVNFGLYTSTQGTLTSGSATNGIWTFGLNYAATTSDVIWYFLVFQDNSFLNNVNFIPATSATITNVNNVLVPPNPALNYTIQTSPTITVTANSATVCVNQPYVIQASGASTYSYLPGGSATVIPVSNTTYSVSGASSLGCPSINTVTINVTALTLPTISVNSGSICLGSSFTISPSGASSYSYQGGSPLVSPISTTNYTVVGSNALGCLSIPVISSVSVLSAGIGATSNTTQVCSGGTVILNGIGGLNYSWSSSIINNQAFTPSTTSIYTVTASSITNSCVGTKTIQIVVNPLPVITLSSLSNTICTGVIFTVSASGASSYTWQPNVQYGSVYSNTLLSSTNLTVNGTDVNGCSAVNTISVTITPCLSVSEIKIEQIKIFPNPTKDNFYVHLDDQINNHFIRLTNNFGQIVLQTQLELKKSQIDVSGFIDGFYILEIFKKNVAISRSKLIIEHH